MVGSRRLQIRGGRLARVLTRFQLWSRHRRATTSEPWAGTVLAVRASRCRTSDRNPQRCGSLEQRKGLAHRQRGELEAHNSNAYEQVSSPSSGGSRNLVASPTTGGLWLARGTIGLVQLLEPDVEPTLLVV